MSKAFTKEDEEGGFQAPPPSLALPPAGFRLSATGARRLSDAANADPRLRDALARAEVLAPQRAPDRAALGVTVRVRDEGGKVRAYRLVTAEELALVPDDHACSVQSPLGRALLGARVGEVRELAAPRGAEELEIMALEGERDEA